MRNFADELRFHPGVHSCNTVQLCMSEHSCSSPQPANARGERPQLFAPYATAQLDLRTFAVTVCAQLKKQRVASMTWLQTLLSQAFIKLKLNFSLILGKLLVIRTWHEFLMHLYKQSNLLAKQCYAPNRLRAHTTC